MGRAPCCSKDGMNKGAWTAQEDQILTDYINTHGEGKWRNLPKQAGLKRCGKSCRLRWLNYLRPDIKRGNISEEEEDLIIRLHKLLGNRWSLIAGRLPGRTDNEVKNYWNTTLRKKIKTTNGDHKQSLAKPRSSPAPKPVLAATADRSASPEKPGENHKYSCSSGFQDLLINCPNNSEDFDYVDELILPSDDHQDLWRLCSADHDHREFDFDCENGSDGYRLMSSSASQPAFLFSEEMLLEYWD